MSELDEESIAFLHAVQRLGGEARSDQIRIETGLSADQRDRRFAKLDNRGYILVSRADEPINGGGYPPRYATLTDKARRWLDNRGDHENDTGADEITVSRTQIEDFNEQLERLENRVDTLTQTIIPDETSGNRGQGPCDLAETNKDVIEDVCDLLNRPIQDRLTQLELQIEATQYLFDVQGLNFDAAVEDVRDDE